MSLPLQYIEIIKKKYAALGYPPYHWVISQTQPPWTPLRKPLSQCTVGLIAAGGIYVAGQVAFHYKDDTSFRVIPKEIKIEDLRITHFGYDLTDARKDPNVVFPIEPLRQLVKEGIINRLAEHTFTFMGGIYSARRVMDELAPKLVQFLLREEVDVALLVPV